MPVGGIGALLDDVAYNVRNPPAGEIDFVAGTTGFVGEAIVDNMAFTGAGFDELAYICVVGVAAGHAKALDAADVNIVGLTIAIAVAGKFAIFDVEFRRFVVVGEDAVFVVEESTVADDKVAFFKADTGAVLVFYFAVVEADILDRDAATAHNPDSFALNVAPIGKEADGAANAANGEVILIPDGDVAHVVAAVDFDGITVACYAGCSGNRGIGLSGTNAQDSLAWGFGRAAVIRRSDGETSIGATPDFTQIGGLRR